MQDNGMVHLSSPYSVPRTVERLESLLQKRPTQVIMFGSPKAGTPLMIAAPTLAIDLPLKALIWEDNAGKVWLSYNSAEYLKQRHSIPDDLVRNIAGVAALLQKAVETGE
jgi:uncharacterized protein (DUF302 family)